jgi:hypothetical protein
VTADSDFERYEHPKTPAAWKELRMILTPLLPFDDLYQTFIQAAMDRISALTNDELDALVRAVRTLSTVNCGWTMYAAGQAINREVTWEAERRIREITEEVSDAVDAVQAAGVA